MMEIAAGTVGAGQARPTTARYRPAAYSKPRYNNNTYRPNNGGFRGGRGNSRGKRFGRARPSNSVNKQVARMMAEDIVIPDDSTIPDDVREFLDRMEPGGDPGPSSTVDMIQVPIEAHVSMDTTTGVIGRSMSTIAETDITHFDVEDFSGLATDISNIEIADFSEIGANTESSSQDKGKEVEKRIDFE